jgi:hypothetical protein
MSSKVLYNIIVIAFIWVVVIAVGVYVTMMEQPEELERVEKAEKVERLKQTELASLVSEHEASQDLADDAVQRWRARYKIIPDSLSSPSVIGYFNELTTSGFENFDVQYQGVEGSEDYSAHQFSVEGRGYFTELYRVIWEFENNRFFYRVSNLDLSHIDLITEDKETGREQMKVMVSFSFDVTAYFAGAEGMSAPQQPTLSGEDALPVTQANADELPVPEGVLPQQRPDINPFFPLIMDNIPPNTHGLLDIENAELVSIVGQEAYFNEDGELRAVAEGEDVYLGQLTEVDPTEGVVRARLNKGGIIDQVELELQTGVREQEQIGTINRAPRNRP